MTTHWQWRCHLSAYGRDAAFSGAGQRGRSDEELVFALKRLALAALMMLSKDQSKSQALRKCLEPCYYSPGQHKVMSQYSRWPNKLQCLSGFPDVFKLALLIQQGGVPRSHAFVNFFPIN